MEVNLETAYIFHSHIVKVTTDGRIKNHYLFFHRHRDVLTLLQDLGETLSALELSLGRPVKLGSTELGKGCQFPVLSQVQLQPTGYLPHGPYLGITAHPGYGYADVQCRSGTGIEQVCF
jgi:hypothetical protein